MAEFTKEQLIAEVHYNLEHCFCSEKTKRLMEIALAALTAEPVGVARLDMDWTTHRNVCTVDMRPDLVLSELNTGMDLYTAPPVPVSVPDFDTLRLAFEAVERESDHGFNLHKYGIGYADEATQARWESWLSCRAAMIQGNHRDLSYPVDPQIAAYEKIMEQAIPDGYALVPVEMTPEQMRAVQLNSELGAYASANLSGAYSLFREFWDVAIAAAPQQEVK